MSESKKTTNVFYSSWSSILEELKYEIKKSRSPKKDKENNFFLKKLFKLENKSSGKRKKIIDEEKKLKSYHEAYKKIEYNKEYSKIFSDFIHLHGSVFDKEISDKKISDNISELEYLYLISKGFEEYTKGRINQGYPYQIKKSKNLIKIGIIRIIISDFENILNYIMPYFEGKEANQSVTKNILDRFKLFNETEKWEFIIIFLNLDRNVFPSDEDFQKMLLDIKEKHKKNNKKTIADNKLSQKEEEKHEVEVIKLDDIIKNFKKNTLSGIKKIKGLENKENELIRHKNKNIYLSNKIKGKLNEFKLLNTDCKKKEDKIYQLYEKIESLNSQLKKYNTYQEIKLDKIQKKYEIYSIFSKNTEKEISNKNC